MDEDMLKRLRELTLSGAKANRRRGVKRDYAFWAQEARYALLQLRDLAKTDLKALKFLTGELVMQADLLRADFRSGPGHYLQLSLQAASWPGEITVDNDRRSTQELYARALQLGKYNSIKFGGKQWSKSTPEVAAAFRLMNLMKRRGIKPPPLTRASSGEWWKRSRPIFEEVYGANFEEHPLFAKKYGNKLTSDASLSRRTWQRKQILTKMAQAFRSLAKK